MTNKIVSMTIAEIEKSSQEFKKSHKIKVSGPYDDEDMPKWFKEFKENQEKINQAILDRLDKYDQLFVEHGWIKK